ncbi:MAG: hypothetical protein ACYSTI_13375, partial [Planctomycetota bacterium]
NQQDPKAQAKAEVLAEQERARQATIPQDNAARAVNDDANKKRIDLIEKGDIDGLLDEKFKNLNP